MCGIAGFYSTKPRNGVPFIIEMLSHIGHRGPDSAGYYVDDLVALGTVRLDILDAATGQQPMGAHDDRFWISYNGELYNYLELRELLITQGVRFTTESDTEVVLKSWIQWGPDSLPLFNGAFAIAIYDRLSGRLILARDRYGKRPLFYTKHGSNFLFASEMKAFLAWKDFHFNIDPSTLASIYGHWTPLPEQTPFRDIFQLPMASWMEVDGQESRIRNYETLDFRAKEGISNLEEAAQRVRAGLEESVRLRLRSDVEVGVYLSGGLDSSIIASLTTSLSGKPPRTFGVTFEDDALDESHYQCLMARHLGSNHVSLDICAKDIVDHLPQAVYHAEMPVFRTALVPMFLLSEKVRMCNIKTILSGEGADEVFLGYSLFRETVMRRCWNELSLEERKRQISQLNQDLKHYNPKNTAPLIGLYQQFCRERMPGLFSHEIRFQNGLFAKRLLKDTTIDPFAGLYSLIDQDPVYKHLGDVEKAQWLEFRMLLSGYLLSSQGERMGLAHGVENRCPFLDQAVVKLGCLVNPVLGINGAAKSVLKKAFEADLPDQIIKRHKHSYQAPDSAAFVAHCPDYLELLLSEKELCKIECLNPVFAKALVRKIFSTAPEQISTRENQAFIYLLSTVLLYHQFSLREMVTPNHVNHIIERLTVVQDWQGKHYETKKQKKN